MHIFLKSAPETAEMGLAPHTNTMKYMNKAILIPILCALGTPACLDLNLDDIQDQIEDQFGDSFGEYAIQCTWKIQYDNIAATTEWMTFEVSFDGMDLVEFKTGNDYEDAVDLTSSISYSNFAFTSDGHLIGQVDRTWEKSGHTYMQVAEMDLSMQANQMAMNGLLHWYNSMDAQAISEGHESVTFSLDSF